MANSKANVKRGIIDEIVDIKKAKAKQFGILRQAESVPTTQSSSRGASGKGGSVNNASQFLRVDGDSMIGPIGYKRQVMLATNIPNIGNDHTFDVGTTGNYTSHIIWGAGGSDQLDIITGQAITGQHLIIESTESLTQTIRDKSNVPINGNINTLTGNDLVLGPSKTMVWFIFSVVDNSWHQVSNPTSGGGGVQDTDNVIWSGTHVFNNNVTMQNSTTLIGSVTTTIGNSSSDNLVINADVNSNIIPNSSSFELGSATKNWFSVRASFGIFVTTQTQILIVTGNTTLGDSSADTIKFLGKVTNEGINPQNSGQANLGTLSQKWFQVTGTNLVMDDGLILNTFRINGDTFLGSGTADNINVTGRISTNVQPNTNLGRAMGASSLRWSTVWTGKIDCNGTAGPAATFDGGSSNNEAFRINNGGGMPRFDANSISFGVSAGFAPAVPNQPVAYLRVKVGGTERRIPYFAT